MRALCLVAVLAATAAADRVDPIRMMLMRLHDAARCDDKASPYRPWCIATEYQNAKVGELPAKNLVGISIELEAGKDIAVALRERVSFVALAVTRAGDTTKLKLFDVKPTDAAEQAAVADALLQISAVFKNKAKSAALPKDLAKYVRDAAGTYPALRGDYDYSWTGKHSSTARQVGDFWVVIEMEEHGRGIWASVLTDRWAPR